MKPPRKPLSKRLGSALVTTLVIVVLITVITVGYLASVMLESKTASSVLDQEKAYGIAVIGAHEAMSRVRDALGPWDDPYKNFAVTNPPFYWSLSPGRISRWSYTNVSPLANFALFSESTGTNLVNLNRALSDGSYPIIGGTNPPDVSVKWANVLRDPTKPVGSNNAIIGRYAFWVDSESAKINLNTADGTAKYTTNSLGIGSPTEVSLQVLPQITLPEAQNIVQIARTSNFQSPSEILRASGVAPAVFTNNVFSLTAYSRSPDLNVFGQPKMALLPLLGTAFFYCDWDENVPGTILATNMVINGITLRPGDEIYPTPSQLPDYFVRNPVFTNSAPVPVPWPLAFRAEATQGLGRRQEYRQFHRISTGTNYCYINGALLANYLAGTNAAGQAIRWPVFAGASAANFEEKYSKRQIDSIVAQIVSLGSKLISSDYPYPRSSDYPTSFVTKISDAKGDSHYNAYGQEGNRYNNAPFLFPGWLSGQFVNGMGRCMKLSGLRMKVSAYGSSGSLSDTNYIPPEASMDIWLEWWLPSGFLGDATSAPAVAAGMEIGHNAHKGALNSADLCDKIDKAPPFPPGPLPKTASGSPRSYWANQLLTNDQGIDFACNPGFWQRPVPPYDIMSDLADPDQGLAAANHAPYAQHPAYPAPPSYYVGQGGDYQPSGFQTPLRVSSPTQPGDVEFVPGQVRSVGSKYNDARMAMQTNAAGSVLNIGGGIAVRGQLLGGYWSDPDPVPLEAIRGATRPAGPGFSISVDIDTQEPVADWDDPKWNMPLLPAETEPGMSTLYDRVKKSVIPLSLSVSVPDHSPTPTGTGNVAEIVVAPVDPLVNKFPGDWKVRASSTIQTHDPPAGRLSSTNAYNSYSESTTSWYNAPNFDPGSYWLPQMDCGVTHFADLPAKTRIPRSARMPNIGYLQYVRTGIIPDNESAPYETQEGTPFRLLSYAPTTFQGVYPDWALLDLLYIPSTLIPYGGEYNPPTNVPMNNNASTNLAFFGTYGGATAGRINPNGAVIYTTNADTPQANVSRPLPLQAVLNGVIANGANVPADTIAGAIEAHIRANGPLRMPAEICNVPTIASWSAPVNATRNDVVRQIVGTLTTQDNVFSVWAVGQAIQKKRGNNQFGNFEPGDNILAEVRLHFIIERYLDPGADGVYGNASSRGADSVTGTFDDPMDTTNHPFQPRYLYRVVASEELR